MKHPTNTHEMFEKVVAMAHEREGSHLNVSTRSSLEFMGQKIGYDMDLKRYPMEAPKRYRKVEFMSDEELAKYL